MNSPFSKFKSFPLSFPRKQKFLCIIVLIAFLVNTLGHVPLVQAQELRLPVPGVMVHLSPPENPPVLKGVTIHPENPFKFDFILDKGDDSPSLKESSRLVKYFLASITTPENDLWVNLSPYEKNRIIPQSFGQTDMGRDLLAEDYILKQITASLIYPEGEVGKQFWKRIYEEARKKFGTTNVPVNTFNKVWIIPDHAKVYEHGNTAFVVNARLKVMLEQDYLALEKNTVIPAKAGIQNKNDINALGSQIVREIVIPELEKEVNEGKNFATLRQVYYSLVLAVWFKKRMRDSILGRKYMDQNKVTGIHYEGTTNDTELIYQRYLKAFKKGVYNYIKEEADPMTQEMIPRKYFSGGFGDVAMFAAHGVEYAQRATIEEVATKDPVQLTVNLGNNEQANIAETSAIKSLGQLEERGLVSKKTRETFERIVSGVSLDFLNQMKFKRMNIWEQFRLGLITKGSRATAFKKEPGEKFHRVLIPRDMESLGLGTVLHEFGHTMDFVTNAQETWFKTFVSDHKAEIEDYFRRNYDRDWDTYFLSNSLEMFAQLFADYAVNYRLTPEEIAEIKKHYEPTMVVDDYVMGLIEKKRSRIRAWFEMPQMKELKERFESILSGDIAMNANKTAKGITRSEFLKIAAGTAAALGVGGLWALNEENKENAEQEKLVPLLLTNLGDRSKFVGVDQEVYEGTAVIGKTEGQYWTNPVGLTYCVVAVVIDQNGKMSMAHIVNKRSTDGESIKINVDYVNTQVRNFLESLDARPQIVNLIHYHSMMFEQVQNAFKEVENPENTEKSKIEFNQLDIGLAGSQAFNVGIKKEGGKWKATVASEKKFLEDEGWLDSITRKDLIQSQDGKLVPADHAMNSKPDDTLGWKFGLSKFSSGLGRWTRALGKQRQYQRTLAPITNTPWFAVDSKMKDLYMRYEIQDFETIAKQVGEENAGSFLNEGLKVVEYMMANEESFKRVGGELVEMTRSVGDKKHQFLVYSLEAAKKALGDGMFENEWPQLVEIAKSTKEGTNVLFNDGFAAVKRLFGEQAFMERWPKLVQMAKEAGENAGMLFAAGFGNARLALGQDRFDQEWSGLVEMATKNGGNYSNPTERKSSPSFESEMNKWFNDLAFYEENPFDHITRQKAIQIRMADRSNFVLRDKPGSMDVIIEIPNKFTTLEEFKSFSAYLENYIQGERIISRQGDINESNFMEALNRKIEAVYRTVDHTTGEMLWARVQKGARARGKEDLAMKAQLVQPSPEVADAELEQRYQRIMNGGLVNQMKELKEVERNMNMVKALDLYRQATNTYGPERDQEGLLRGRYQGVAPQVLLGERDHWQDIFRNRMTMSSTANQLLAEDPKLDVRAAFPTINKEFEEMVALHYLQEHVKQGAETPTEIFKRTERFSQDIQAGLNEVLESFSELYPGGKDLQRLFGPTTFQNRFLLVHLDQNLYHTLEHSLRVAISAYRLTLQRWLPVNKTLALKRAIFMFQVGLLHDYDPQRPADTPASVERTLKLLQQDWEKNISLDGPKGESVLQGQFQWTEQQYLEARLMIDLTDFPNPERHLEDIKENLRQIYRLGGNAEELKFVLEAGHMLQEYADKGNGYMVLGFEDTLALVENLAKEMQNANYPTSPETLITDTYDKFLSQIGTHQSPWYLVFQQLLDWLPTEELFVSIQEGLKTIEFSDLTKASQWIPSENMRLLQANKAGFMAIRDAIQAKESFDEAKKKGIQAADRAMNGATGPGGIDLTAKRMNLEVEKDKAAVSQQMGLKALENIEINGLYIKDIEIKPLKNLPELLGVSAN